MSFVHLQITTGYSLLSSTISIDQLIHRAKELEFQALAITDRNVMYGVIPFYQACKEKGIKPIIGLTLDVFSVTGEEQSFPLVLLAKNQKGYQNLLKLSSAVQTKSKTGVPAKWLKAYSEGLLAFTPGLEGEVEYHLLHEDIAKAEQAILTYQKFFAKNCFYLSLQNHQKVEEKKILPHLLSLSEKLQLPCIVSNDVRFLHKEDSFAYQCALLIRDGKKLSEEREEQVIGEYHLKTKKEMQELFEAYPSALQSTIDIAKQCQVEILFNQTLLPKYPVSEGRSAKDVLYQLCYSGLKKIGKENEKTYVERLQYELDIITRMGFSDYFLIVWDFMKYAREQGILTGPGRGSAAGSLVAYVLQITKVDPLEYDLLFERFLNPERITMPDIDLDFPDHRRDEVIEYVKNKYGDLHVAQIITFGTLSAKAVMRDVARSFGFNTKELEQLSRMIPTRLGITLKDVYDQSKPFRDWVHESKNHAKLFQTALKLEGLPRHTSTHAAGVVITERPLVEHLPVQEGNNGIFLTQFPMDILEKIGLLKIDFLGLRNLTILERIMESIYFSTGQKVDLSRIPMDDPKTFQLLSDGHTTGVFQLESDGMRKVLSTLKPTEFEDIVAVNALYRPGPMENIPTYIERKHGKKVEYPHEDLKGILQKTYGVLIYQEQIMQIASKMAGFTLGEADLLRRAVSKKKKEVLTSERKHFVKGSLGRGYSEETAHDMYDLIVRFANYGFNRSHAVAYSFIAYQLAYLKAHFPVYFMAALFTSVIGNEEKIAQYVKEAKEMGINILPPSIQKSQFPFRVEKDGIRFSLGAIKGVGVAALREIISARKDRSFHDLFDFCLRVSPSAVNRKTIESLVFSGAMDDFGVDRATLLASIDPALAHVEIVKPFQDEQSDLFDGEEFFPKPKYTEVDPLTLEHQLSFEKEVLGLYLSNHPVTPYKDVFSVLSTVSIIDVKEGMRNIRLGVMMNDMKTIRTKKGEVMAFLTLSDDTGDIDAVVFPEVYKRNSAKCQKGKIGLLEGKIGKRNGKLQFIVSAVFQLEEAIEWTNEAKQRLYLKINDHNETKDILNQVYSILKKYRGNTVVILFYESNHRTIQLRRKNWVEPNDSCLEELKKILGAESVVLKPFIEPS
ncbi:DNA polymerase-3 subunit alpha [Oikeobacillus pervagus]|uniref:DNA polymerase III subunit alpha n=1 Tax=Oikeobacillus pervagus TaxID=1325931 RepID=A0AAJ1T1A5_9BACI|nr:DNA polymerase III subunit alpha [Oikeobacillus pervagus]MDQ0214987.1 DNA polymerase-3 subunit alpha [Oikeobacillus pervagus]